MSLTVVPDIDDSLAANQEPEDLDQRRRRANARKGDGHYKVVFVEGRPPEQLAIGRACRRCGETPFGGILHADPSSTHIDRTICGTCQGKINAERNGMPARRGDA